MDSSIKNDIAKELNTIATDLFKKHNIRTDRDLTKKLKLNKEQKDIFFAWVKYQSLFEYRKGLEDGEESVRSQLKELLQIPS